MPMPGAGSSAGSADAMVDLQIVRSIQFWIRAYPRRWREVRGEELLDLVVDLVGPDARRLGWRAAVDLLRGGWATRWREHPPLHTWLLYRTFDRRIPVTYRSWAIDDISGLWYPPRRYVASIWWLPIFLLVAAPPVSSGGMSVMLIFSFFALAAVASMFLWPESYRNRAKLKHIAPRPGERPVEGTLGAWDAPRTRTTARSTLTWAVLFLGITAAASFVAALLAPKVLLVTNVVLQEPVPGSGVFWESGPGFSFELVDAPVGGRWIVAVAILLVALGAGVFGAAVTRRRLTRLLGERLDQRYRVLRPVSATGKANALFWAIAVAALARLEVSGRMELGLSVVLGVVSLLLLPGTLVALVVTRDTDAPDLAGSDVWWITARGRLPRVDQPVRGLRLLPGPSPMASWSSQGSCQTVVPLGALTPFRLGRCSVRNPMTVTEHLPVGNRQGQTVRSRRDDRTYRRVMHVAFWALVPATDAQPRYTRALYAAMRGCWLEPWLGVISFDI